MPNETVNLAEVKNLIEQQNKAFEAFKQQNESRLSAVEKGSSDPQATESLEKINARMTELQNQLDSANKIINRKGLGGDGTEESADAKNYQKSVMGYLRGGKTDGMEEQARGVYGAHVASMVFGPHAALRTDSDSEGGVLVDPITVKRVSEVVGTLSAVRSLAEVVPAFIFEDAVEQDTTTTAEASEAEARSETAAPTFEEIKIQAEELYAEPRLTQKMIDLRSDAESYLTEKVGKAIAKKEGLNFVTGNGVKKARGFLDYTKIANANYAWGKTGYIASGAAGAFASANAADKLLDLIHSLKSQYRTGAVFLMADLTQAEIRKLKDGEGNYLWKPGILEGQSPTLLGYRVETDDNMPVIASNSYSIAFANWRDAYKITDPGIMTVLRDPYTAKPFVKLYTRKYVGGGVGNFEALKLMKFAVS